AGAARLCSPVCMTVSSARLSIQESRHARFSLFLPGSSRKSGKPCDARRFLVALSATLTRVPDITALIETPADTREFRLRPEPGRRACPELVAGNPDLT